MHNIFFLFVSINIPRLTEDNLAKHYGTKFSTVSLYLTKIHVTWSFVIASSVRDTAKSAKTFLKLRHSWANWNACSRCVTFNPSHLLSSETVVFHSILFTHLRSSRLPLYPIYSSQKQSSSTLSYLLFSETVVFHSILFALLRSRRLPLYPIYSSKKQSSSTLSYLLF